MVALNWLWLQSTESKFRLQYNGQIIIGTYNAHIVNTGQTGFGTLTSILSSRV